MAKIPFDIKYRPQIESGEYKVETRGGHPTRIICWDRQHEVYPLVGLISSGKGEICENYTSDGRFDCDRRTSDYDLIIITPEPELTEFERQIENLLNLALPEGHAGTTIENAKKVSAELLALAKKELEKDLPRWKKCGEDTGQTILYKGFCKGQNYLEMDGYRIMLSDLEKLPKEDEK